MPEESWKSINKQVVEEQPLRNAKRLELLRQEQEAGIDTTKEIKHQEQNLDNFSTPKVITKEKTIPSKIEFSPRMLEFFGTTEENEKRKKLNEEMTVPSALEKPEGWLNDYLNGVINRTLHPLETMGKIAQEFIDMPPDQQAMQLVGGGVGTFIGKNARFLWSPMRQEEAQMMEKVGRTSQEIKEIINLHRGAEGEWRSEISDINMKINIPSPVTLSNGVTIREASLGSVVDHPELFQAYPGLAKNFEFSLVETTSKDMRGSLQYPIFNDKIVMIKKGLVTVYKPKEIIENLSQGELDSIKRTVIHEIQHAIQKIEGWQGGANYTKILKETKQNKDLMKEIEEELYSESTWFTKQMMEKFPNLKQEFLNEKIENKAYLNYLRVAGEVEARLASMRGTMTQKELRELHPFDMGEIHVSNQILK